MKKIILGLLVSSSLMFGSDCPDIDKRMLIKFDLLEIYFKSNNSKKALETTSEIVTDAVFVLKNCNPPEQQTEVLFEIIGLNEKYK